MGKRTLTPRDGPVLAIDPGPEKSGWVYLDSEGGVRNSAIAPNATLFYTLMRRETFPTLVVERMGFMGPQRPAGNETHETNVWSGHFLALYRHYGKPWARIYRRTVQIHHTGGVNGDPIIRAALIDRFGGKAAAIGGVHCRKCKGKGWFGSGRPTCPRCGGSKWESPPGPLNGVVEDCWQALALGLAYRDGVELANHWGDLA